MEMIYLICMLPLQAERLFVSSSRLLQTEQVERNYIKEKKAAVKEFDDKKVELKENLIAELEEKKKMIENEKLTMELTGGKRSSIREERVLSCSLSF